jgi:chemotaxis protein MotA
MNLGAIISLLSGILVTFIGIYLTTNEMMMFWDVTSIFIVIGGTLAATAISVRMGKLFVLFKIFFNKMIRGKTVNFSHVITELIQLNHAFNSGKDLSKHIEEITDPFLKESLELYLDDLVDDAHFLKILRDRVKNMHKSIMIDIKRLKNIGKYPPAFGMMGTTMGMVVLLSNLGGKDAMKTMGPAMAVCLITTLYGVIFSNVLLVPISENIDDSAQELDLKHKIIVEGMKHILLKTPPAIMTEELNSHLGHEDRLDWKEVLRAS